MRYQDWDVLLFPEGSHVPLKEFKTTCYAVHTTSNLDCGILAHGGERTLTPLLTTFVPSIARNHSFTISVHAWEPSFHPEMREGDQPHKRFVWQVRVLINGLCVSTQKFPAWTTWPLVIKHDSPGHAYQNPLRFPPFAKQQRVWDPAADVGRVKVELSPGYDMYDGGDWAFHKLATTAVFSFYPAPMDHLQKVGIAWPSKQMFENPLHTTAPETPRSMLHDISKSSDYHRRSLSHGSIGMSSSPSMALPQPPPPTPVYATQSYHTFPDDDHSNYDLSSRSTSAYSNFNLPGVGGPPLTNSLTSRYSTERTMQTEKQRVSDEQMVRILQALGPEQQKHLMQSVSATQAMPPPPLPLHAITAKHHQTEQRPAFGQPEKYELTANKPTDCGGRRAECRGSDVSMHASCTHYPTCLFENDMGQLLHSSPIVPATVIKGKKEGSSPNPPRDFMSTILTPTSPKPALTPSAEHMSVTESSPAGSTGRKHGRYALRDLSIDHGSPEKTPNQSTKKSASRKVSRTSVNSDASTSSRKSKGRSNVMGMHGDADEDKENVMVVDA